MSHLMDEIASQPECWAKAIELAASAGGALPAPGERAAVIGCGSSLNVARCYAALREAAGQGETDAFPASEVSSARRYDRMVFVSRTGTTTEVLDALRRAPAGIRTTAIAADPGSPLIQEAGAVVLLDFSAERSVVSSRFITSTLRSAEKSRRTTAPASCRSGEPGSAAIAVVRTPAGVRRRASSTSVVVPVRDTNTMRS